MVKDVRRQARRRSSAEDKIRIALEGLRGEDGIAEMCRRPAGFSETLICSRWFSQTGLAEVSVRCELLSAEPSYRQGIKSRAMMLCHSAKAIERPSL